VITLMIDGAEFVDYDTYREALQRRDELADQLAVERAKTRATRKVIEHYSGHIAKMVTKAVTTDGVYGLIAHVALEVGPGIQLKTLAELKHRLNKAHARIHERAEVGVALDWEDDDYGISD